MNCENCKNKRENELERIPYAVYELDMAKADRTNRRLVFALCLSIASTIICAIAGAIF